MRRKSRILGWQGVGGVGGRPGVGSWSSRDGRLALRASLAILITASLLMASSWARGEESAAAAGSAEALPGIALAETLATTTGIAISPLLGVGAVGAWHYFRSPEPRRPDLPWYCNPWFWGPALFVGLALVLKDPLLGLVPGAKKPLDAVDVLENKASALLAVPAVVPMMAGAFGRVFPSAEQTASQVMMRAGLVPEFGVWGAVGLGLVAFFIVWLASHAVNVLILLSPFGPLDALLRCFKLVALVGVVGASFVHPYLGLGVSVLLFLLAIPVAGWSLRLSSFGGVLAWDLLAGSSQLENPPERGVLAFAAGSFEGVPVRTLGTLSRCQEDAVLLFTYRPWLVLPRRRRQLEGASYVLGRGLLYPSLLRLNDDGEDASKVLRLPPRYRRHEEAISRGLGLAEPVDLAWRKGLGSLIAWVKEMTGRAKEKTEAILAKTAEVGGLPGPEAW